MAYDYVHGTELWMSDGTPESTVLFRDFAAGSAGSYPANLTSAAGRLFFTTFNSYGGSDVWTSDGLPGTTSLVRSFAGAAPSNLVSF